CDCRHVVWNSLTGDYWISPQYSFRPNAEKTPVLARIKPTTPDLENMLTARNLHKEFVTSHGTVVAIGDISFDVTEKAFVSIVGPSGAGKTTLLRCLAGLEKPTSGIVTLNDETITEPPRDLAVVFQDYTRSLLPWFSVQRNVAFPLNGLLPKSEVDERVNEAIEAVGLSNAKDRLPWQLSGGMQQRAAIARAIAYRPKIL